jgi:hypothetical protein
VAHPPPARVHRARAFRTACLLTPPPPTPRRLPPTLVVLPSRCSRELLFRRGRLEDQTQRQGRTHFHVGAVKPSDSRGKKIKRCRLQVEESAIAGIRVHAVVPELHVLRVRVRVHALVLVQRADIVRSRHVCPLIPQ